MRLRLPHPGWMLLGAILLMIAGTIGYFGWNYRQALLLEEEVLAFGGHPQIQFNSKGPTWLVEWMIHRGHRKAIDWLRTDLIQVQAHDKSVDDVWVRKLQRYKTLEVAWLDGSRLTDTGIESLASLPNLKTLQLAQADITDTGIKSLPRLTKLTELGLGETQITDAGLSTLGSLTNLKSLSAADTLFPASRRHHTRLTVWRWTLWTKNR